MADEEKVPKPGGSETEGDYMHRCMSDPEMNASFPEQEQRAAVCMRTWRESKDTTRNAWLWQHKGVPAFAAKAESIDEQQRTLEGVVSSDMVDRDGEILEPSAFVGRIAAFRKNPVFLWNHDPFRPPIGKVEDLHIGAKTMEARFRFRPEGDDELADNVFRAYRGGFLTSFSIGYRAFEIQERKDDASGKPLPPRVKDAELFEISAVTIPANTEAVVKHDAMLTTIKRALYQGRQDNGAREVFSAPSDLDVLKRALGIVEELETKDLDGQDIPRELREALERHRLFRASHGSATRADVNQVKDLISFIGKAIDERRG